MPYAKPSSMVRTRLKRTKNSAGSDASVAQGYPRGFREDLRLFFDLDKKAAGSRAAHVRRQLIPYPDGRCCFRKESCLCRPIYDDYSPAHCGRPHHALDHHTVLLCPARQRCGNCHLAPALLLGRSGQRIDSVPVRTADPGLEVIRTYWLRVRSAGPERLEPVSPLSSRLGCGIDRLAVYRLRPVYTAFPEILASGWLRSHLGGAIESTSEPSALQATW